MDEAYEELERISQDKNIIGLYDKEKVEQKIINTRLLDAELRGKKEGKEEGKFEIAKKLFNQGISVDIIENATGLSKAQIETLMD